METRQTEQGPTQQEVEKKRSYTNAEIAHAFFVAAGVFQGEDEQRRDQEQESQFLPLEKKPQKIKRAEEYVPQDFALENHEKLPFTHAHKWNKTAIERNSLSLTNKFVHEGEFSEEQNIIMGADEQVKSLF